MNLANIKPKEVEFFRYMIPINSLDDGDESVTYARLTYMSRRPRQRRVLMKRFLMHTFTIDGKPMNRKQAFKCIRDMEFSDLLCES